jgi:hypothetical protein
MARMQSTTSPGEVSSSYIVLLEIQVAFNSVLICSATEYSYSSLVALLCWIHAPFSFGRANLVAA